MLVLVENMRLACKIRIDVSKFIKALVKYIDYIESSSMVEYANDNLLWAKNILMQDEKDSYLKWTRVMTHLENAYIILKRQKDKTFSKNKKDEIQHKIDQICCELAMLHKWMGNPSKNIMKYAIELTSLKNPVKDHLGIGGITERTHKYFIMTEEDLKFLIGEVQHKEYMKFYYENVPEAKRVKEYMNYYMTW